LEKIKIIARNAVCVFILTAKSVENGGRARKALFVPVVEEKQIKSTIAHRGRFYFGPFENLEKMVEMWQN